MNLQGIKNRIRKVFVYTLTVIVFLFISAFLVLQMPPVQNRLIDYYLKEFSNITGFRSTIDSFKMLWFDRLELQGVRIYDPEGNKMISAREIMINFKLSQLLQKKDINIDGIYLDSAHVYLTKIESDTLRELNIDVLIARINENFSSGSGGRSPRINIGEAFLNRSQFTYIDPDRDSIKTGFNYNQFSVAVDEGQLNSFVVLGDTVEFNLRTLIAQDIRTKFFIKEFSTFFRISQQSMEFSGMNLQAGNSTVSDTIIFTYDSQLDLGDFINKVKIHAHLKNTVINPHDLALFAPGVERIGQPLKVDGVFNGRVSKFKVNGMGIRLGNTSLHGSLDMDGLPVINETFIIVNLKNSHLDPTDLSFILDGPVLERLRPMGRLHMDGQFLGYPTDFVANGSFAGKLGDITSDINFKVNEKDFNRSEYSGKISLHNFDLGTYFNDTVLFQKVTLNGKISGSGLTQNTADFLLNGHVSSFGINRYNYTNIITDARFASGLFQGFVDIKDPNLKLLTRGSIDLRDGRNHFQVQAKLDTAFLHRLNLSKERIFLRSSFNADIRGLSLDSLEGTAYFNDLAIQYKDKSLHLDKINLRADRQQHKRSVVIESTLLDAEVTGDYTFTNLSNDIQTLAKEISLNIKNDQNAIINYYQRKTHRPEKYEALIKLQLKNIQPITQLLNLDVLLSKNTFAEGRFTSGQTSIFNAYTDIDSLGYQGTLFLNTQVELTASKIVDSTAVLAMATINSENQVVSSNLKTKNLLAEGIWNKNHIDFGLDADQVDKTNYVRLKGSVDFLTDSTFIAMDSSMVKLLERDWHFVEPNSIINKGSDWTFRHLTLMTGTQSISVNGKLSPDPSQILTVQIDELDLSIFNVLSDKKFEGTMNAQLDLSNYFQRPTFQNALAIKALTVNDFLIGDVTGNNLWDTAQHKFNINLFVDRNENRMVKVEGNYKPSEKVTPLNLTANLQKAQLKILEPFLTDIFSSVGGTVSGQFKITGQLDSPAINGEGLIDDGQVMIAYLKTMYRIKGTIGLSPNSIYFKNIDLTDAFRNNGQLNGTISHQAFSSMMIDLTANFKNFQVLNTSAKDNSLFYGQAYASGNVNIFGPVSNLRISSTARTEKNTRIYIPIGGTSAVEKKEFITFVNFSDTTFTMKSEKGTGSKVNLTGLAFDLNLDVTPDAYCEIIFDPKTGDIIRGRGNGDLKFDLDTKGDFNMLGTFEFNEGWYNFTLYDIINKEFEIKKGSTITWYGDPYLGTLQINATYNQLASFGPIVSDQTISTSPALRRRYPVQVLLKLEGPLLSPQINFDILAKDLPKNIQVTDAGAQRNVNLDIEFTAFKNKLDEQELNRQVFSLIVLRKFSPPDALSTSGSVFNSVSELFSNQLSYWISQVDQNLEIDVDLGAMDEEAFNTFQLRFSYTFLNGRLRITGDNTFNNATATSATTNQPSPSTVAGDWTVDYMLTADGKLRVKMYSRTNVNPILSSVNNQTTLTTGASLIHTQSFNQIKDLWRSARKKRKDQNDTDVNKKAIKEDEGSN